MYDLEYYTYRDFLETFPHEPTHQMLHKIWCRYADTTNIFKLDFQLTDDMIKWCETHVGLHGPDNQWFLINHWGGPSFNFRKKSDAMMFKLAFSRLAV